MKRIFALVSALTMAAPALAADPPAQATWESRLKPIVADQELAKECVAMARTSGHPDVEMLEWAKPANPYAADLAESFTTPRDLVVPSVVRDKIPKGVVTRTMFCAVRVDGPKPQVVRAWFQ